MATTMAKFDRTTIEGEIATLTAIVEALKEKQGSAAKRLNDATLSALGETVKFAPDDVPANVLDPLGDHEINLGDLATFVQNLDEWAEQLRKEKVNEILKASAIGDDVSVLREQYVEKREMVEALIKVAGMMGVDITGLEVPHLRAGRPKGSTTKSKTGSRWARFYRIVDGVRKEMGDSQNSLSSFAWYYGAKMLQTEGSTNQGKGVPASDLEKFLRNEGVESPNGKPWSLEIDGVTYGLDVTDNHSTSTESNEEE